MLVHLGNDWKSFSGLVNGVCISLIEGSVRVKPVLDKRSDLTTGVPNEPTLISAKWDLF